MDRPTAPYDACDIGYFEIAEVLLRMKANPNVVRGPAERWTCSLLGVAHESGLLRV